MNSVFHLTTSDTSQHSISSVQHLLILMDRTKALIEEEKCKVIAFESQGLSMNQIATAIGRSRHVVQNFLKLRENYAKKNPTGRPSSLTSRDKRRIQQANNKETSLTQIKTELGLTQCKTTVWNVLRSSTYLRHAKKLKAPCLQDRHKIQRLQ